ncbi:hypothetical protein CANCADRAFT_30239 [Tortispora caseinolytica NRRL Y-17796]|uniref:Major facilitator superfamily (MFS) profile domain-containing protein n=1 Tax=Tortispora caseinolytica NRRL Y-17796 TaxID=767744 RepID=A0A1E4TJR1_9ASCO|nr:hypothetical protein CANCADRAFT_30239 [Tortispora caseinolytica NRRL Y-17796]
MKVPEINEEVIPGTVHQVDLQGTLNVKHEAGHKDIVLIPQPTRDPEDPLNWSKNRKLLCAIVLMIAVFSADVLTTALSAALLVIEEDTGISLSTLNQGVGVQYLFFGWANVIWQPLALTFGRRPVLLFGHLGCLMFTIWSAYVKSGGEWYVNRLLVGAFYGPIETTIEICIADIYFLHERGNWIGAYCWTLFNIPFLSGIAAGFIASNLGWQWIQFIASIIGACCLIIMFFFLEETMYYRPPAQDELIDIIASTTHDMESAGGSLTAPVGEKADPTQVDINQDPSDVESEEETVVYHRKTYMEKLKCWGFRHPDQPNHFWRSMYMPFLLVRFPAILYSGITVGAVLSWFNVVNATIALILAEPPYNFSTNMIGVMFVAPAIGITIGSYFSGWAGDSLAIWMARRNGGIREPEHRIWIFLIPFILHPAGCILYGVGANHGIPWIGLAFGLAMICSTFPIGSAIAINYIIDAYKEVSGDGLVTMICIRNSMGFGFSYGVTPWINACGVQDTYIALAFMGMFFWGISLVMIWWGKKMRKSSARAYWQLVEKYGLKAH